MYLCRVRALILPRCWAMQFTVSNNFLRPRRTVCRQGSISSTWWTSTWLGNRVHPPPSPPSGASLSHARECAPDQRTTPHAFTVVIFGYDRQASLTRKGSAPPPPFFLPRQPPKDSRYKARTSVITASPSGSVGIRLSSSFCRAMSAFFFTLCASTSSLRRS